MSDFQSGRSAGRGTDIYSVRTQTNRRLCAFSLARNRSGLDLPRRAQLFPAGSLAYLARVAGQSGLSQYTMRDLWFLLSQGNAGLRGWVEADYHYVPCQTPGEPGGALGVVSLEDVIEEMIGEEVSPDACEPHPTRAKTLAPV